MRLGAKYWQLGYKNEFYPKGSVNINYVTFPLSVLYRVSSYMSVTAGTYLSFTINNTNYYNGSYYVGTYSSPITSVYHKNDTGVTFGAEFDIYKSLAFNANYILGTK